MSADQSFISLTGPVAEGWAYRPAVSREKRRILGAIAPSERVKDWGVVSQEPAMPRLLLREVLLNAVSRASSGLVIAFSHDHYLSIAGGVQNCVGDEQSYLCGAGWAYLHLCPNRPLPLLAETSTSNQFEVYVSLNGETLGVALLSDIEAIAEDVKQSGRQARCIVHHLLGFAPELVAGVIAAYGDSQPIVWIHDLFTLCPSVHLLRNDATFCFAPPASSPVCGICNAGPDRGAHVRRMRAFFAEVRASVVAPSATLLNFWARSGSYSYRSARVIPPCEVAFDSQVEPYHAGRSLRVAFLGAPTYHKGWDAFASLARWHSCDQRYEFFHFGSAASEIKTINHRTVTVTRANRLSMVEAVRASKIDVVVNWSMCYESFSFTAVEAIAAGAFIVARRDAGNVWPLIESIGPKRGMALASELELLALFATGDVVQLAADRDRRAGTIEFGRYSGQLLVDEESDA